MKKLISVRLEEAVYSKLLEVAKPFGGVGKWIAIKLTTPTAPVVKEDTVKTVSTVIPHTDRKVNCMLPIK